MLRARKIKRQKGNNTFLLMLWTFWIRIQEWVKHKKKWNKRIFSRQNANKTRAQNFVTKRNWNILISQTFKQAEQMIETLREQNSCDHHKYKQFIFFGVLTHKKWSSRHVFCFFFFDGHNFLLAFLFIAWFSSSYTHFFYSFFHIAMLYHRLPTYLPKKKIFSCSSSLFLLLV